jgi:4-hydroxy-3-polyprenylbenzoate decarboxylase
MTHVRKTTQRGRTSRRNFIAGTGLAAVSAPFYARSAASSGADHGACVDESERARRIAAAPKAPFDSIRDYMAALDAYGLLLRIPEIDQDEYQMTALMFRATDEYGFFESPAFIYDKVKIDGEWINGPVIGNFQGHVNTDCIAFGLEPDPNDIKVSYRRAKAHMNKLLDATDDGRWPQIAPVELARAAAPCKEITVTGDDIDLNKFAFVKTNPADAGRYVNTGSVFTSDPELGNNFGTYRCEITGPRTLRINSEKNHAGYKMLMAARERGEKVGHVSIAVGQDPIIWLLSGAPLARQRGDGAVDELAIAGGMRGKALEVVRSDTNEMLVPAHAEMIIEGEVPLDEPLQTEGPFGEMFGYLGPQKQAVFWMNVTRITHRRDPWLMNSFTGMQRGYTTSTVEVLYERIMRRSVPNLIDFHYPQDMMGVSFVSINKTAPGQGLEVGRTVATRVGICKVVVVVDADMDVLDRTQMLFTMGSRWQPDPATEIISEGRGNITDPSSIVQGETSKIVIDATMQWPEEGGPENYAKRNRVLLEELAPDALAQVNASFGEALKNWGKS